MNCWVVPLAIEGFAGLTAMETTTAGPTVSAVLPVTPPDVALICDVPSAAPLARPLAVMVATLGSADVHATELVRFCVPPSV